ncbi:hypothetical protein D3C71_1714430 [compost metagenome]
MQAFATRSIFNLILHSQFSSGQFIHCFYFTGLVKIVDNHSYRNIVLSSHHDFHRFVCACANENSVEVRSLLRFYNFSFTIRSVNSCFHSVAAAGSAGYSIYRLGTFSCTCGKETCCQLRKSFLNFSISAFAQIYHVHAYTS